MSVSTDRRQGISAEAAVKVACRAATTANITLSGEQTIDGIACVTDDRVLVKNQTSSYNNGIYVVDTGDWSRAPDFDGSFDVVQGTLVPVNNGTAYSDTIWRVTTIDPITIDTSLITFEQAAFSDAQSLSFTQAGTGAVQRTAQTKLREIEISVEDYSAVGDGVTDDTAAFAAANTYLSSIGGGVIRFHGKHLIDSNLTLSDYVSIQGPLDMPDEILPAASADYDGKRGVLFVNSAATIKTGDGSAISHCVILRKGLNLPFADASAATTGVAAFAGTALTVNGAGSYFHHLLILGFARAIDSSGFERVRCQYVFGDNTNGIRLVNVTDLAYVENCHFWPFTTTHQSWTTNALLVRTGTGYEFSSVGDWSKATNCFAYGYAIGFLVSSCNNVNLVGCGADYVAALTSASIGFDLEGTSRQFKMIGCQAAAQGTSAKLNSSATSGGGHRLIGCEFWDCDVTHISVVQGRATIIGNSIFGGSSGITVASGSSGVFATNNDFDGITTPWTISGTANELSSIFLNRYFACTDSTIGDQRTYDNQRDVITYRSYTAAATGPRFIFDKARGSAAIPSAAVANDTGINLRGRSWDGSQFGTHGLIRSQVDTVGAGSTPGKLIFSTTPSAAVAETDHIQLLNTGHLAPITTNAKDLGDTTASLSWRNIYSQNAVTVTSDLRAKTSISESILGLDFINLLRPVSYKAIVGRNDVLGMGDAGPIVKPVPGLRTHWGLIAQEVKAAADAAGVDFGGWVLMNKDDPDSQQALRYDQFIAPLIKAIQELTERVRSLESRQP